jgi:glycoside/pentoside/hexuronide:cation symporter, GPH family
VISFVLVFILLQFYKLDKIHPQIVKDLEERNKNRDSINGNVINS